MSLMTTVADVKPVTADRLDGFVDWPVAALPIEADLAGIHPADVQSYISPGRIGGQSLPIRLGDAAESGRVWAAQNTGITVLQGAGVLAGLPRYNFDGSGGGLYASLAAPLTDYTVAGLVRLANVSGNKGLFGVGTTAGTRLLVYFNASRFAVQHGSGDVLQSATGVMAAEVWTPVIASYRNSDKALRLFAGSSLTPVLSGTFTNSPPSEVAAALGSTPNALLPMTGQVALCTVWSRPVHTDPAALAALVDALTRMVAL